MKSPTHLRPTIIRQGSTSSILAEQGSPPPRLSTLPSLTMTKDGKEPMTVREGLEAKIEQLSRRLKDNFLFKPQCRAAQREICLEFISKAVPKGGTVMEARAECETFFLLTQGIIQQGSEELGPGATLNDLALMHGKATPSQEAVAKTDVVLWTIPGAMFRFICTKHSRKENERAKQDAGETE